ncbi:hypothetical protein ACFL6I_19245 [candidate division KSB1 bacterium]
MMPETIDSHDSPDLQAFRKFLKSEILMQESLWKHRTEESDIDVNLSPDKIACVLQKYGEPEEGIEAFIEKILRRREGISDVTLH